MSGIDQRNDDLLFTITQQTGQGIDGLLNAVFGFLQRRTDFFYEMEPPGDKMGFPPGIAESMVYQYFKKYQEVHFKRFPHKPDLEERWKVHREKVKKEQEAAKALKEQAASESVAAVAESKEEEKEPAKIPQPVSSAPQKIAEQPKAEPKPVAPKSESVQKMEKLSTYNGDSTDKYNWSQTVQEVEVQIPIPEGTKSNQLDVKIKQKHLSVAFKGKAPFIEGELGEKVKVEDSFWSIEERKFLNLHLCKAYEAIWKCVVVGDKEIDPKTVDNSKRIEEFDLETQGHLQKVLYEQERKKRGLPTTEEEEQQKLMAKIMQADNSPFKGVPYDPAKYGQNPAGGNMPSPPFNM